MLIKLNSFNIQSDCFSMFLSFLMKELFFSFCRGVGCIFTEMVSGVATFPGMKDTYDQLDKIFWVS